MRRINSDFQTLHISEEGQKLSNRDYFGYVEMDDFACYVLADSLDDEPAVNSARLVVDSIIRDFTEAPTMGKGTLRRYLLRAHTELLKQRAGMHLKVAVVVAVTDYRTLRYCHVGNSRLYLIRNARILEQTKDQSLTQNLLEQESLFLSGGKRKAGDTDFPEKEAGSRRSPDTAYQRRMGTVWRAGTPADRQ